MAFNFKHRISIVEYQPNDGPEPGEGEWVTVARPWADIRTMKGHRYEHHVLAHTVGVTRFIIRYMSGIKPTMKIVHKGIQYEIESITNDDEQNRTITIIGKAILLD